MQRQTTEVFPRPISGVVFDVDGTLLNTEPLSTLAIIKVLKEVDPSHSTAEKFDWPLNQRILGLPRNKWIPLLQDALEIHHLITEDDFFHKWESNLGELTEKVEKMPGVVEMVNFFHSKHIPMAVATSSTSAGFNKKRLKHADIFDKFSCFVCGDDAEIKNGKPEPDIYLLAAKRLGVDSMRCLAFEDALSGVKAAVAAGMSCYAIPDHRLDTTPFSQNTSLPILKSMTIDQTLFDFTPPFRQIRAIHSEDSIRVYQSYNDAIADAAVASNSFQGPLLQGLWSKDRMTWIKPSAIWMGYRCGWTMMKDENQRRVLSLELSKSRFFDLLRMTKLSHEGDGSGTGVCKDSNVVVQWDPERRFDINNTDRNQVLTRKIEDVRSIQIGLRNQAVSMLLDPSFVLNIRDVTANFRAACACLQNNKDELGAKSALFPDEQECLVEITDAELRKTLGMDLQ